MRVTEIRLTGEFYKRIETTTDAIRLVRNEEDRARYIEEFGNVVVRYDADFKVYRVEEFNEQREAFTAAKARDCAIWGCE